MGTDINIKYLIANKQDKLWGITVTTVGYQRVEPYSIYPPINHPSGYMFSTNKGRILDEYVLLYITNGKGTFSSDNQKNIKLTTGSMLLLFPGEWHNYEPNPSTGWDEYWIGFKGEEVERHVENGFFRKEKEVFNVGFSLKTVQLYQFAIETADEQNIGYQQILAGIAKLLLAITHSHDKCQTVGQNSPMQLINKAKLIMFENSDTDITVTEIADRICMSYSCFRRNFKQLTGLSPHQYLQELRIQKSKELLINTNLTCQEISYKIGYESPIHFNSVFKKKTGLTPIKYREYYQMDEIHTLNCQ